MGTFTARRVDYRVSPAEAPSWSRMVRESGSVPRTVVRSCSVVPMPAEVAALLRMAEDTPCHRLRRRSFTDDVPAAYGTEWVPVAVVPELAQALRSFGSLDAILRGSAGAIPRRAWTRASMAPIDPGVATEPGSRTGDPAWLVESLDDDAGSGRLLCFTQRWMRADAVRVLLETGSARGGAREHSTESRPVAARVAIT
uniref:GntR family transcriptional regulator n=1 Tax=Herbidospora sakaeratensis TaxID=564415 RepID=UPI0007837641|nr:GntR family transcriptional regulator [Herbidospora sakaeratensis]